MSEYSAGALRPLGQASGATVAEESTPPPWMTLILLGWLLAAGAAAAMGQSRPEMWPIMVGALCSAVVTIPMTARRYVMFGPWTLVALVTYIACGIRPFYVAYGEGGTRSVDELFLLGKEHDFFFHHGLTYLLGLTLLTVGYLCSRPDAPLQGQPLRMFSRPQLGPSTPAVVVLCAAIGMAALYWYVQSSGGVSLQDFSGKQASGGTEMAADYESNGIQRSLTNFLPVALWLHLAYVFQRHGKLELLTVNGIWAVILFLLSCLFPIFSSSRADIAYILFVSLAVTAMMRFRISPMRLVVVALAGLLMINFITAARGSSTGELTVSDFTDVGALEESIIYNRNFADFYSAAHIMDAVPDRLAPANGSTITGWVAAPIPRALWPDKPLVHSGPIIGEVIYGNGRSGVPPGLVSEMYWNWGWMGVLLGTPLCGFLLGLAGRVKNIPPTQAAWVFLFCASLLRLGTFMVTLGVGGSLFKTAEAAVYALVALWLCASDSPLGPREKN